MIALTDFEGASWDAWRAVLARLGPSTRELWVAAGRGSGKSRAAAWLAVDRADHGYQRVAGELIYIAAFAPDRRQAGITFRYVRGLIASVPRLEAMVVDESKDSVELSNGVAIEVLTSSSAAPRGRSYAAAVVEEAAFLPTDESANPDTELLRALRPGLARVPGSLLVVIGSPYARKGELWKAHQKWSATGGDTAHVYVNRPTLELNPLFDQAEIARAYDEDPISAAAEYGANFRDDVSSFVPAEVVDAAVDHGVFERPHVPGTRPVFFVDVASGSGGDAFTLAAAHVERDGTAVLDLLREWRPPFSPAAVVEEACGIIIKERGCRSVTGDRYGAGIVAEMFAAAGVRLVPSTQDRSTLYLNLLPLLTAGRVRLLDGTRLRSQLISLERRTSRGGRDSVDAGRGGHEDAANAAAGAIVLAAAGRRSGVRDLGVGFAHGDFVPLTYEEIERRRAPQLVEPETNHAVVTAEQPTPAEATRREQGCEWCRGSGRVGKGTMNAPFQPCFACQPPPATSTPEVSKPVAATPDDAAVAIREQRARMGAVERAAQPSEFEDEFDREHARDAEAAKIWGPRL